MRNCLLKTSSSQLPVAKQSEPSKACLDVCFHLILEIFCDTKVTNVALVSAIFKFCTWREHPDGIQIKFPTFVQKLDLVYLFIVETLDICHVVENDVKELNL